MRNRLAAGLALISLAVGLAGCGATGVIDPVAAAATKTDRAGGVTVKLEVAYSIGSIGSGTVTGNGAFDQDSGEMTLDMSGLLQAMHVPAGSAGEIKQIYVKENGDPVLYMSIPFLASTMPGGKTWMRLDLQRAGNALGVDLSKLLGQSSQNPVDSLGLLRAAGTVEKVGAEQAGGVAATRYHVTVDLAKALTMKGVSQETVKGLLAAGAPAQMPVDVWIGDDDGLVHEFQMSQSTTAAGQPVSTTTTLTLSNWGSPVSVQAPPADQVFDTTSFLPKTGKA